MGRDDTKESGMGGHWGCVGRREVVGGWLAMKKVIIHTDGGCSGNPGPGGWAAILRAGNQARELSGGEPDTTNNRMELRAAIEGFRALTEPHTVKIFTDSVYLKDGITKWL